MIHYRCTDCWSPMEAPDSLAGEIELCPVCRTRNTVAAMKACPYCGEEIKFVALVCRFCRMSLETCISGGTPQLGADRPIYVACPPQEGAFLQTMKLACTSVIAIVIGICLLAVCFLLLFAMGSGGVD